MLCEHRSDSIRGGMRHRRLPTAVSTHSGVTYFPREHSPFQGIGDLFRWGQPIPVAGRPQINVFDAEACERIVEVLLQWLTRAVHAPADGPLGVYARCDREHQFVGDTALCDDCTQHVGNSVAAVEWGSVDKVASGVEEVRQDASGFVLPGTRTPGGRTQPQGGDA